MALSNSVWMDCGFQCVATSGDLEKQRLCAHNLDLMGVSDFDNQLSFNSALL